MSVRDFMNNNSAIMTLGAVGLLVIALAIMINTVSGGEGVQRVETFYFYDLETGELFEAPIDRVAPIEAPSGPGNGVRARVFAGGKCVRSKAVATYLEKSTRNRNLPVPETGVTVVTSVGDDEALAPDVFRPEDDLSSSISATMVRAVDGGDWVPAGSAEAVRIIEDAKRALGCPDRSRLRECFP